MIGRLALTAWPFTLCTNFPVQFGIVGLLVATLAAVLRSRLSLVIAVVSLVVNGGILIQTLNTDPRPAQANSPRLTFGHLNAQTRPIDVGALGQYLDATRPDVFVVLDPTQSDVPMLTRTAPGYRVHRSGQRASASPDYVRTVVFSRTVIDGVQHPRDRAFGASAVEFVVPSATGPVSVVVFGTDSPTTPERAHRRDQALNAATRWSTTHPERRIVMGDFNSTPWSPEFGQLLREGDLFDSLDGFGLQVSWPESNIALRIPIDHALLGPRLAATDRATGPAFGSQHRSLEVTVTSAR